MMISLITTNLNDKYAFLLNSYVQKTGLVTGVEVYCAEKGKISIRV